MSVKVVLLVGFPRMSCWAVGSQVLWSGPRFIYGGFAFMNKADVFGPSTVSCPVTTQACFIPWSFSLKCRGFWCFGWVGGGKWCEILILGNLNLPTTNMFWIAQHSDQSLPPPMLWNMPFAIVVTFSHFRFTAALHNFSERNTIVLYGTVNCYNVWILTLLIVLCVPCLKWQA